MAYDDAKKAGAVLGYGQFITTVVNFLIIAWVLFLVVKGINSCVARRPRRRPAPPAPTNEEVLLTEIRDLLARRA